jgi:hypothetical protein
MRRRPEDLTLGVTASGVILAIGAAVLLIIYAMFTGAGLASPVVTQNLTRLSF